MIVGNARLVAALRFWGQDATEHGQPLGARSARSTAGRKQAGQQGQENGKERYGK
jgi:hypothetical protein